MLSLMSTSVDISGAGLASGHNPIEHQRHIVDGLEQRSADQNRGTSRRPSPCSNACAAATGAGRVTLGVDKLPELNLAPLAHRTRWAQTQSLNYDLHVPWRR
jgi:hypothetical protein